MHVDFHRHCVKVRVLNLEDEEVLLEVLKNLHECIGYDRNQYCI